MGCEELSSRLAVKRVTITDVAKRAGVSHTTVSWVIHDDPRISRATKDKVLTAIQELDYHPNLFARSLVSGKSGVIAVFASFFSTIFELEIMQGIERCLKTRDIRSTIQQYSTRASKARKESLLREILHGRRADAVICLSMKPDPELIEGFHRANVPLLLIEENAPGATSLRTENRKGARLAVEHLVARGRTRIALVGDSPTREEFGLSAAERFAGYREALQAAGLPCDDALIAEIPAFNMEGGREAFRQLLARGARPDAVFSSGGDLVALGVIAEARAEGMRVPEDLAVVGFDDSFVATLGAPQLTTIRQPLQEMGERAILLALDAIAGHPVEGHVFDPVLVVREST